LDFKPERRLRLARLISGNRPGCTAFRVLSRAKISVHPCLSVACICRTHERRSFQSIGAGRFAAQRMGRQPRTLVGLEEFGKICEDRFKNLLV